MSCGTARGALIVVLLWVHYFGPNLSAGRGVHQDLRKPPRHARNHPRGRLRPTGTPGPPARMAHALPGCPDLFVDANPANPMPHPSACCNSAIASEAVSRRRIRSISIAVVCSR